MRLGERGAYRGQIQQCSLDSCGLRTQSLAEIGQIRASPPPHHIGGTRADPSNRPGPGGGDAHGAQEGARPTAKSLTVVTFFRCFHRREMTSQCSGVLTMISPFSSSFGPTGRPGPRPPNICLGHRGALP